ncbi:hypothetical protein ACFV6Z_29755 [Streptomyces sp. NPDC059818]|uniref:hypothetical protein n=1 Tax=Streptomyces sp. NPDC059818 TaxID=3346962 RepID=UPI0036596BC4
MTEMTPQLLERALKRACSSFAPDELAYLALTSKPEHPIRDRLAWVLHTSLPGHITAREWSPYGAQGRTDLAVLNETTHEPLALVEMKAAYTFDFARKEQATVGKYSRYMADDLAKATTVGAGKARVYGLMLLTHPSSVPRQRTQVVKYGLEIARSLTHRSADDLSRAARENARLTLQVHGKVNDGTICAGTAFGIDVDINYLLVSPG